MMHASFNINDFLFEDYFYDYNSTNFIAEYQRILSNLIEAQVIHLEIAEPINIDSNVIVPSYKPTYAPHVYQTANEDTGKLFSIMIASIVFGTCCCGIMLWTCKVFCQYEIEYEKRYRQNLPTNPQLVPDSTYGNSETVEMQATNGKHGPSVFDVVDTKVTAGEGDGLAVPTAAKLVEENTLPGFESDENVIDDELGLYMTTPR